MSDAASPLQEVVDLLIAHGFLSAAKDFELQISSLASLEAAERAIAAQAIVDRCNARWLGDLYLDNLSLQDWWGLLDRAADFAKKAARFPRSAPKRTNP